MIREEEIKIKALSEYRIKEKENKKATGTFDANLPRRKAFIEGAQWADKTMIEKARQWFNLHFRQVGTPREIKHDFQSKEKMWKSFTQFMEE